jgi:hypothetical protein
VGRSGGGRIRFRCVTDDSAGNYLQTLCLGQRNEFSKTSW